MAYICTNYLLQSRLKKKAVMAAVNGMEQIKPMLPVKALVISVATIFKFIIRIKETLSWDAIRKISGNELPV